MDGKQLHEAGKQLSKANESGDSPQVLLGLLAPLENVKVTEELLRQSKIGVAVSKLRQHDNATVRETAGRLVLKWKKSVKPKKQDTSSPGPANKNLAGAAANGRSGTSSPAPAVKMEAPKSDGKEKFSGDPETRNSSKDGVDINVTGDKVRDACVKLMYDGISFMSTEMPSTILEVARQVEEAGFDLFKRETSAEYKGKMRSLFQNLKIKGNKSLRKDVSRGNIEPKQFVSMTSDELKSSEKRAADDAIEKENMMKAMTAQKIKAISTTLTCGKCKKSKVSYTEAQTRSADEPLTLFCECVLCGNVWRQG